MLRLLASVLLFAAALPAQFLEFEVRFDDGGCITCAESLEGRMQRVRGVEQVTLDLEKGLIRLELAEDNPVRLVPLMARIEQGGAKALETKIRVKGELTAGGDQLALGGAAQGQVYSLEGDSGSLRGAVVVDAELLDSSEGRLKIVTIHPAP